MRPRPILRRRVSVPCLILVSITNVALLKAQEAASPQATGLHSALAASPPPVQHIQLRPITAAPEHKRPAALIPLYVSLVGLQGLDIHSTRRAMNSGATRESNPMMKPFVNNDAAFIAVKATTTAGTIFFTERLRKKHPKAAVVVAAALNVGLAAVVASNYRLSRRR